MIIRAAKKEDHAALAELFLQSRLQAFAWADPSSFALEDFVNQTEGEAIHLAEDGAGGVLGFISVWEAENFIHHLFVAPGQRRKGIGHALVSDLAKRRQGPFTLKCLLANASALSFYRATGWREAGKGNTAEGHYLLLRWDPSEPYSTEDPHDRLHHGGDDADGTGSDAESADDAPALRGRKGEDDAYQPEDDSDDREDEPEDGSAGEAPDCGNQGDDRRDAEGGFRVRSGFSHPSR